MFLVVSQQLGTMPLRLVILSCLPNIRSPNLPQLLAISKLQVNMAIKANYMLVTQYPVLCISNKLTNRLLNRDCFIRHSTNIPSSSYPSNLSLRQVCQKIFLLLSLVPTWPCSRTSPSLPLPLSRNQYPLLHHRVLLFHNLALQQANFLRHQHLCRLLYLRCHKKNT